MRENGKNNIFREGGYAILLRNGRGSNLVLRNVKEEGGGSGKWQI